MKLFNRIEKALYKEDIKFDCYVLLKKSLFDELKEEVIGQVSQFKGDIIDKRLEEINNGDTLELSSIGINFTAIPFNNMDKDWYICKSLEDVLNKCYQLGIIKNNG